VKIRHCYAVSQQASTCVIDITACISIVHTSSSLLKKYLFPDNIINGSSPRARQKIILDVIHAPAVEFLDG